MVRRGFMAGKRGTGMRNAGAGAAPAARPRAPCVAPRALECAPTVTPRTTRSAAVDPALAADAAELDALLDETCEAARAFLHGLVARPAAAHGALSPAPSLPERGLGAREALRRFRDRFEAGLSASAGPRYLGFVTGGATPASLAADWLVSAYDQNTMNAIGSAAACVEVEALAMLRALFALPEAFAGTLVTGATAANFVGLAAAREWAGERAGRSVSEEGLAALPSGVRILAGTPHASVYKALSMLGLGRRALETVATLPGREAVDPEALRAALTQGPGAAAPPPTIVVASAGTVNTGDFDDLEAVASLCRAHGAWLHVDAAFGLFAACSPETAPLLRGLEHADSIAADAHKWLNVPYDCGLHFGRHLALQERVFRASGAYLAPAPEGAPAVPDMLNRTPENSRRFRALPVWMTLAAYGRAGYRELVERSLRCARALGAWIDGSPHFERLAPVHLNVVCFALAPALVEALGGAGDPAQRLAAATARLLDALQADGRVFLTPTTYAGRPAIRAAFSSWATREEDVELVAGALADTAERLRRGAA